MNEIITKLNEIEEKAECILADAASRKDQMMQEHEKEKRALNEKYEQFQAEKLKVFEEELRSNTRYQIEEARDEARVQREALEQMFSEKKEVLAEDIFQRMIQ